METGQTKRNWVYFGGRTAELVAKELGERVIPFEYVEEFLQEGTGLTVSEVAGVIVTDMSLQTITNWVEVERLANALQGVPMTVFTDRSVQYEPNLPGHVQVRTVAVYRVEELATVVREGER